MDLNRVDRYLTTEEIDEWKPYSEFPEPGNWKEPTAKRMKDAGVWGLQQVAGKRWPVGCVSLEITQRCNLDCTLCYLSDASEAVKDVPLPEVFRRIDMIYKHYGPPTDVQISGGDPTLRKRSELVQIVKRVAELGMKPTLFTNGILASRSMLEDLAAAGLVDVAFHVDLTQERKGYKTEEDLNEIRLKYIERAKGLGINVMFNTTVFDGNFKELPDIAKFFVEQSDHIQLASFQLQADTGRGVLRERDFLITQDSVGEQISKGAGTKIEFGVPHIGHPKCNSYGIVFKVADKVFNFLEQTRFFHTVISESADFPLDRERKWKTVVHMFKTIFRNPILWTGAVGFFSRKLWEMKGSILRSGGKASKITFYMHNFMDEEKLEKDRCDSCIFMVATPDGPISMCVHNAKRDEYLLKKIEVKSENNETSLWNPLTGEVDTNASINDHQIDIDYEQIDLKNLKGRVKEERKQRDVISKSPIGPYENSDSKY